MQQYKMLTRTILMLSIINFTLPAPLPVRERPEVRLDANVTRNMTAASQKRGDSSGSTKVPGPDLALPPSPDSTDTILRLIDFGPPYSPESSTGYVQSSPISPTGSQLPAGSMPVAGSLSSSSESGSVDVLGPHHALPPSPDLTDNAILRLIDFGPPYSPESSTGYVQPSLISPTGSQSMPVAGSLSSSLESGSMDLDVPGSHHALPPSPDSTDNAILRLIDSGRPYSPESPTGYVRPSPISSTGSQLPAGSMPVASTLLSSPPEKGSMDVPGLHHTPVPTDWSESMQHVGFGIVGQHKQTNNPPLGWGELPNLHRPDHTPVPSLDSTPWSELMQYVMLRVEAQHRQIHSPLPPWDREPLDWGTLNVPVLDYVPPPSPDIADILSQVPHADRLPTLDSLGSSTGSHYVPPSPGPPTGSVGPMPVVGSLSPLPPPLPHPNEPGLSDDRYPPGFEPKPEPGPSPDRYPPGFEPKPNTLPSTGSTGTQPISPQPESQGVDPETHPLLNSETFPIEFWNKLLKGKIKRRISGSDSVGLAQKDPRSRLF